MGSTSFTKTGRENLPFASRLSPSAISTMNFVNVYALFDCWSSVHASFNVGFSFVVPPAGLLNLKSGAAAGGASETAELESAAVAVLSVDELIGARSDLSSLSLTLISRTQSVTSANSD